MATNDNDDSMDRAMAELELLTAAYPDEIDTNSDLSTEIPPIHNQPLQFTLTLTHTVSTTPITATITMALPPKYPYCKLEIISYRAESNAIKKQLLEDVVSLVRSKAEECVQYEEEAGLTCCQAAMERWEELWTVQDAAQELPSIQNVHDDSSHQMNQDDSSMSLSGWMTGSTPITDRKSTFQAFVYPNVKSEEMIEEALKRLVTSSSKMRRATHHMYAYRFTTTTTSSSSSNPTKILKHDNSDDGEHGSGARLAQLLQLRNEDGVLVVVSRWFGGIHLGPKRFAHIVNVARDALEEAHEAGLLSGELS